MYGSANLTTLADLVPPERDVLPMADQTDYSLVCTLDSDHTHSGSGTRTRMVWYWY
jgi:hypothetical protein